MSRLLLGRIPADTYVKDRLFVPNVPPADNTETEVYEQAPELDAGGGIRILRSTEQVQAEPYSPGRRALACGLLSAATATTVGGLAGGLPGALTAGLTALTLGGALGGWSARNDSVSVLTREEKVTLPVMTGYRRATLDEPYTRGKGRLHYALPTIEHRPVGLVKKQDLTHSAMRAEKAALLSAALGVAVGLTGYLPVPVIT
ncbi:hypothetical protein DYH09_15415 [bacterium CPR1]|nr:hypothetical protein [bacterium CPR1]